MKENVKLKIAIILTLLGVVSIIIGTTYAIYENTINSNKSQIIKTGVVNFTLTETTNGLILNNLQELSDYEGMAQETYYEFSITNTGDTKTDYEIYLIDKNSTSYTGTILDDKYVKVGLLKNNSEEIIVNLKEVNRLIDKVTLDVDKSANYKLRLWLDLKDITDEEKEALVGQKIFLALKINGIQNMENITIATDKLIALTNNKDNSGLYTITHPKDSTLQIGNDKDIIEYRYRGVSPKNHVTFNNEVWRIIGVFPTDDGTGKIENRVKIIRNESVGNYYWNTYQVSSTSSYNNWTTASLKTELNETYYTSLSTDAQNMVSNTKYYLGGYNTSNIQKDVMYQYERKISGSTYYYGTNPNSWTGKIALMYASDYGYAASDECTQTLNYYYNTTCINNNWLHNIKTIEWILPQTACYSDAAFSVDRLGGVDYDDDASGVYNAIFSIRPVLYLISSVQITGGDGTESNPYNFSL